jgi:hypothetical protein
MRVVLAILRYAIGESLADPRCEPSSIARPAAVASYSTFPASRKTIERDFAGIPAQDRHLTTGGNAARLYGINL